MAMDHNGWIGPMVLRNMAEVRASLPPGQATSPRSHLPRALPRGLAIAALDEDARPGAVLGRVDHLHFE